MDKLSRRRLRRARFLDLYNQEGGSEKIDNLFDRVYGIVVRLYRKIRRRQRTDPTDGERLRRYNAIYQDLMMSGIFIMDAEHRHFMHTLNQMCADKTMDRRIKKALTLISR